MRVSSAPGDAACSSEGAGGGVAMEGSRIEPWLCSVDHVLGADELDRFSARGVGAVCGGFVWSFEEPGTIGGDTAVPVVGFVVAGVSGTLPVLCADAVAGSALCDAQAPTK